MNIKETAPAYLTQKKNFTYQDYLKLPDDGTRYEIIEGELIMTPAPSVIHQRILRNLIRAFDDFVEKNQLGEVLFSPVDVVLSETNVVEPDVLFISTQNSSIIGEKNISGAPDLLIEIISPSSGYYDMIEKKELYQEFGVREYWIVDPKKKWVEIYKNQNGKFELLQRLDKEGVLASNVLEGFKIEFNTIWGTVE